MTSLRWPRERPLRTILGFAGVLLAAKVVHRVRFERAASVPPTGPAILVANHLSMTETLAMARLVVGHRRFPHFLAMSEVFTWPVVGALMRAARQIPVVRGNATAADSLAAASAELRRGHVVCLYPEGHLTRRPDLMPGPGKTGAARLALAHPEVPVVPVGMWGPRPGAKHIWHRHTVRLVVGEPIDLSPWADPENAAEVREVTDAIMHAITALVLRAREQADTPR